MVQDMPMPPSYTEADCLPYFLLIKSPDGLLTSIKCRNAQEVKSSLLSNPEAHITMNYMSPFFDIPV
eukprot:15338984-Ditylum_brightwellii.AAC.1